MLLTVPNLRHASRGSTSFVWYLIGLKSFYSDGRRMQYYNWGYIVVLRPSSLLTLEASRTVSFRAALFISPYITHGSVVYIELSRQ